MVHGASWVVFYRFDFPPEWPGGFPILIVSLSGDGGQVGGVFLWFMETGIALALVGTITGRHCFRFFPLMLPTGGGNFGRGN